MFKAIFNDFFILFNRRIIPVYLWLFLYSFLFISTDNIFLCSYLREDVFGLEENIIIVLFIPILYVAIKYFFYNYINSKIQIKMSLLKYDILKEILTLKYKLHIYIITTIKHIIDFNFKKLILFTNFIINYYKSNLINNLIIYIFNYFYKNNLIWYTLFKTHSIYGYYRATRLNFIDLRNENMKRYKY
uniref:Ymf75 n=1 Tax=Tetrahymena paravorax TaxID=5905 RepID=Q09F66_TETPR|nr:Ymf75 [Tetrahymena paravorax]ABI51685.1 Ymf75 [Tetrahymena paravorax]